MIISLRALLALISIAALCSCGGGGGGTGGGGGGGGGSIPNTTAVSVNFVGATPTALAVAMGTGAFTTLSAASSIQINLPTGTTTYQLAVACPPLAVMGTITQENVYRFAISDGTALSLEPCYQFPTANATITGSFDVSAVAGATQASILGISGYGGTVNATSGAFSVSVPSGTTDVAVVARDASFKALAVKFVRNQTAPGAVNGGATIALTAADQLVSTPVTINGIPAGYQPVPALNVSINTANKTYLNLPAVSPTSYSAVAAADTIATDYYQINTNDNLAVGDALVGTTIYSAGGATTLNYPAALSYAGPTPAAWPTFALSYSGFSGMSAVNYQTQISWQTGATTLDDLIVTSSSAYLGSSTTIVMPDLSTLSGFFNHPASGTTVNWLVEINGGTFQSFVPTFPSSGSANFAQSASTYIEP